MIDNIFSILTSLTTIACVGFFNYILKMNASMTVVQEKIVKLESDAKNHDKKLEDYIKESNAVLSKLSEAIVRLNTLLEKNDLSNRRT